MEAAPDPLNSSKVEAGISEEIRNCGGHPQTTLWGFLLSELKYLNPGLPSICISLSSGGRFSHPEPLLELDC